MTNICLTDSDVEALVDFMKEQAELYDKTNELSKNKARKDSLWESFTRDADLQDMVLVTKDDGKLTQSCLKELTERLRWIHDKFEFLKLSEGRASTGPQGSGLLTEDIVPVQDTHTAYQEALCTQTAWRPAFATTHTSHPLPALPVAV